MLSTCNGLAAYWTNAGRSQWEEWYPLASPARALSTVQSQPLYPVKRCGLTTAQALEPSLS